MVQAASTSPTPHAPIILNPSQMDDVANSDTCIQCHSQGQPLTNLIDGKAYDWPVGYHVGLHLADFWKLEDHTLGQTSFTHFPDRNRPQEPNARK